MKVASAAGVSWSWEEKKNATSKVNHHVTLSIVANIHFAVIISNNRKDIFHSIHHDEDKGLVKPILDKDLRHS